MAKIRIGEVFKTRRDALHITQGQVADLAGISVNTLYKIERGLANPTLESLEKIADILGLEVTLELKGVHP